MLNDQVMVVLTRQLRETAKVALSHRAETDSRPDDEAECDLVLDLALNLRDSGVLKLTPFQARYLRDALITYADVPDHRPDTVKDTVALAREISAALIKHNERNHA